MSTCFGTLTTRPPVASDDDFLARLYASTRADLLHLPVPAEVARAIIRHQQQLQAIGYAADFPHAEYLVLESDGVAVGRAVIDTSASGIRLVDISIAPEARRRGYAATVLRALQERGDGTGIPVTLRVRRDNAGARALYADLGFVVIAADEIAEQMCWTPPER
ncbi:GNAT family N-acetyltransferase [Pseudoduganella sp. GCM10020061]|uniref:GNAT family N-acetyltransferase n=1 Tax=Pseudoduganella sp. GCM10020061 TaxID=3317345 RepID=UPI003629466A